MSENNGFSDEFKNIKEDYLKSIPEKLNAMSSLVEGFKNQPTAENVKTLRNHVHQLAGNAGTFGFQEVTDLCKTWDLKLKDIVENFAPEKIQGILGELEPFIQKVKEAFNHPH